MYSKSIVAIAEIRESVFFAVRQAMERGNWKKYIKKDRDIALKINLGWDLFIPGSITSPLVTEGVIKTIYYYVKNIYIVESNQVLENIEKAFYRSNTNKICDSYSKVKWLNLSKLEKVTVKHNQNSILKSVDIPKDFLSMDFITVAVMKTHDKSTITGALKNQWGCLPESRHEYHLQLNQAISDINTLIKPVFSVIDGSVGLEGNGPKNGRPKEMNLILASHDPVAVDTIMSELMGFDSSKIEHLKYCYERKLGEINLNNIDIVGGKISDFRKHFKPAKHNLISRLELFFRKSFLNRILFNTFLFSFALVFGKFYYYMWMKFKGKKIWKEVLNYSIYGDQWLNSYTEKMVK